MNFICRSAVVCSQRLRMIGLLFLAMFCGLLPCAVQAAIQDPLDFPSIPVGGLSARPMQAVGTAGERLVAVGARGVIAISDDRGKTWSQSASPVQSDLVAVHFPTAKMGWAVGHDGVVLHSQDGGKTWQKQLDGRLAKNLFVQYYKAGAESGNAAYKAALGAIERNYKTGPTLPLLDVWFDDERNGFAVGAFGLIIATTDGGRTWIPWLDRIDNTEMLHLNAIRGGDGGIYIAAERGAVFRLDRANGRFGAIATGYTGSFFGLAVSQNVLLAYGLKGAVYRSADHGRTWDVVNVPSQTTISGGTVLKTTGAFALVNVAGEMLMGDATGLRFSARQGKKGWRYTGIAQIPGEQLLLTALEGIQVAPLK
ncbi:YCF48-related protein [Noviherbaspirillum sedimenti]|uniref:Glycosyl hydrolase n=1 Tax=Noviherbaspirillum sedimenti TaxID=2320865 RepID=A0A3A3G067_9BURK|nr:YCF48-related protein [Noviherbaspirillum sedimenti]RJG01837.1 glycosyl hydrolase [Noviherbaspirillum sedimenti]